MAINFLFETHDRRIQLCLSLMSFSVSLSLSLPVSVSLFLTLSPSLSLSLSHTLTHTHTLSLRFLHTLSISLTYYTNIEYFRDQEGQDVLLFVDNIFRFTQAGSEVSALLGRIPSAVGYQPTLATDMGLLQERITSTGFGSITSVQVCTVVCVYLLFHSQYHASCV